MKRIWIARDKNGCLYVYSREPWREEETDEWVTDGDCCSIHDDWFPDITWVKSPIEFVSKEKEDKQ